MLIDTHAHLNFSTYKSDADEVAKRTLAGDTWMINVGSQHSTSKRAVEIAEKYKEGVYAAIGLHPIHAVNEEFIREDYRVLAKSSKVVAVGEIGLDYKAEYVSSKEKQKEVFLKQLDLAKKLNLPVIFHCRMAHKDVIALLQRYNKGIRGVIHCFTGSWTEAQKYLDMGFCLGFNGIIFKLDLDKVIEKTPLDRILVETDCPYLSPPQASERNEPLNVKYIAEKIAEVKGKGYEEITGQTTKNAKELFNV